MNLPRSAHARDAALLLARLLLGTIMLAHGHQKLLVEGLGRTSLGFEHMSIPCPRPRCRRRDCRSSR